MRGGVGKMKRIFCSLMIILLFITNAAWANERERLDFSSDEILVLSSREGEWFKVGSNEDGGELYLFASSIIGLEKYYQKNSKLPEPQSYKFLVKQKINDQEAVIVLWELDFSANRGKMSKVYFITPQGIEEKNPPNDWFHVANSEVVKKIQADARKYAGERNTDLSVWIMEERSTKWFVRAEETKNWHNVNPFVSKLYLYIPDLVEFSKSSSRKGLIFAKVVEKDSLEIFQVEIDLKNQRAREWDTVIEKKKFMGHESVGYLHADYNISDWVPIESLEIATGVAKIVESQAMIQTLQNLPVNWEEEIRSWYSSALNRSDWIETKNDFKSAIYFQKDSLEKAKKQYLENGAGEALEILIKFETQTGVEVVTKCGVDFKNQKIQSQMMLLIKEDQVAGLSTIISSWESKSKVPMLEFIYDEVERRVK